ncbi:SHOCT domain-containing protein [Halomicroarcula sp. F13]|uniref:SHOCT domain-containing protein n=1 Tax=Haloarcula rubra TaxID=2487747 RepID=A0AAW4PLX4_9EURY|nr:SHOCT domain-containing protein [Halomicroarcula rubra]MBX0321714.1 SHOCT domain-containing protein [Halomicroarcula rubra]
MSATERDSRLVVLVLLVLGALLVLPALAMGFGMMGYGMMGSGMWGGGGMWGGTGTGWMWLVGLLFQLLFLAAVVGLGYLVYRAVTGGDGGRDAAVAELREAYARGDLTDEEYERRLERLREE